MSERTCSCIQMNGDGGWYLLLPEPAGPPDPPSNWAAKERNEYGFFLFWGFIRRYSTKGIPAAFRGGLVKSVIGEVKFGFLPNQKVQLTFFYVGVEGFRVLENLDGNTRERDPGFSTRFPRLVLV